LQQPNSETYPYLFERDQQILYNVATRLQKSPHVFMYQLSPQQRLVYSPHAVGLPVLLSKRATQVFDFINAQQSVMESAASCVRKGLGDLSTVFGIINELYRMGFL